MSVILILMVASAYLFFHSKQLAGRLDRERLENESLVSEKIHLSRSVDELEKEVRSLQEINSLLTRKLEDNKRQNR